VLLEEGGALDLDEGGRAFEIAILEGGSDGEGFIFSAADFLEYGGIVPAATVGASETGLDPPRESGLGSGDAEGTARGNWEALGVSESLDSDFGLVECHDGEVVVAEGDNENIVPSSNMNILPDLNHLPTKGKACDGCCGEELEVGAVAHVDRSLSAINNLTGSNRKSRGENVF